MYAGVSLEPSRTSMGELLCKNHKKASLKLHTKYASGIGFIVEKVYRISLFIWYTQNLLQKFFIAFLFLDKEGAICSQDFFAADKLNTVVSEILSNCGALI